MRSNHSSAAQTSRVAAWLALIVFLSAAGFFLWTEHRAHIYSALPYLLFLACPLMHLFMHHHGHRGSDSGQQRDAGAP